MPETVNWNIKAFLKLGIYVESSRAPDLFHSFEVVDAYTAKELKAFIYMLLKTYCGILGISIDLLYTQNSESGV